MSGNPLTKTRSVYGTSSVDSKQKLESTTKPSTRRDSAAPLMNTPPIQPVIGIDPLDVTGTSYRSSNHIITSGSYARHGGHRTGLFRPIEN
ncbi:hypothetical protein G6F42_027775 [Rhizopus arrhizus]|nr:hypothetical protein G6F42_027775 [Rhizopus arrhizus]